MSLRDILYAVTAIRRRLTFEISGTGRGAEAWRSQTKARVKFPLHRLVRRRVVPPRKLLQWN